MSHDQMEAAAGRARQTANELAASRAELERELEESRTRIEMLEELLRKAQKRCADAETGDGIVGVQTNKEQL